MIGSNFVILFVVFLFIVFVNAKLLANIFFRGANHRLGFLDVRVSAEPVATHQRYAEDRVKYSSYKSHAKRAMVKLAVTGALIALLSACPSPTGPGSNSVPGTQPDPALTISSPALTHAEVGQSYEFTFAATNLPSNLDKVVFVWSFVDRAETNVNGREQVAVGGGQATHQISYTYPHEGIAVVVVVEDTSGEIILTENGRVVVGVPQKREFALTTCNSDWTEYERGHQGVTVDVWDISKLPVGAVFDMSFRAHTVPDKYVVEYNGNVVLDTGWRGDPKYKGRSMYPGEIGDSSGQKYGIFTKVAGVTHFTVTGFGPQRDTGWDYSIRANCN